jgi:hypothetical protein
MCTGAIRAPPTGSAPSIGAEEEEEEAERGIKVTPLDGTFSNECSYCGWRFNAKMVRGFYL